MQSVAGVADDRRQAAFFWEVKCFPLRSLKEHHVFVAKKHKKITELLPLFFSILVRK